MTSAATDDPLWLPLMKAALAIQHRAYAPYSAFQVGAAIEDVDGGTHVGCNVENASYGLCICAERNAAAAMVASGKQRIRRVVVASRGGVAPCGACRQFLSEFGMDFDIAMYDSSCQQLRSVTSIRKLLPSAFAPSDLDPNSGSHG